MSERLIREQLSPEEQARRASHRHAIAEALNIARQYDGTEEAYGRLMNKLVAVEEGIKGFGFSGSIRAQDTEAALLYTNEKTPRDIDSILEVASDSQRRLLSLERTEHPYVYEYYKGLILQPGDTQQPIVEGDGQGNFEARFDTIVHDFIELLKKIKIYSDDLIITIGDPPSPNMMRQESYVKIEIPRLRKTVLLCNQIGEATFVIQGYIPNIILSKYTKEDFKDNPLYPTRRIVRGESWSSDVLKYLLEEEAWGEQKREQAVVNKVNVKDIYELRIRISEQIRKQYTPDKWLKMSHIEAVTIKVGNRGLFALAIFFGVEGNQRNTLSRLRLGAAIWPESFEITQAIKIEERTSVVEWREVIIQNGWTPNKWLEMDQRSARLFKIDNRGLKALATIFGVEGDPFNTLPRLRLGAAIWPESDDIKYEIKVEERTPIEWREAIHQNGWTPDKWFKINQGSAGLFKVDDRGLKALATIFKVEGSPFNALPRLRLGSAIWPESDDIKHEIKVEERTSIEWREAIQKNGWTPGRWLEMNYRKACLFKVDNWGLKALARIFGVKGDLLDNILPRLRLGAAIWPESREIAEAIERLEKR